MTHRSELKKQTRTAVDLVAKWHKSVAGTIIADEYISDLSPFKGAELCIAAEVMFSLAYIYQFLADNDIADWVEQAAFNAFPASMSADWWAHQYVQQLNQVRVSRPTLTACPAVGKHPASVLSTFRLWSS